jgi:hypothetical protein
MARRLAAYLRDRGQSVNGLANAKPYSKKRSIIRYRPGCRDAALALAERLPLGVELIEADLARADLELMLGRDFLGFDRSLQSA